MKIAILGTGTVGQTIGNKLLHVGHSVVLGSRTAQNTDEKKVAGTGGAGLAITTFAEAARFGELVFNCTNGENSLNALRLAGAANLSGKILIDVANPLDFSRGAPPSLTVCNTDSLGEQIQREFPDTRVVKTLNTVNCEVMVAPSSLPGDHQLFTCSNDATAKSQVADHLANWFGWKRTNIVDLGGISAARGTEAYALLWVRLYSVVGHANFNLALVNAETSA